MSTGFDLYFSGAEQKGWQRLLLAEGVSNLGIAFAYYFRKVKKANWELPDFPAGTSVLLDSGGYGANKDPGQLDPSSWREYEQAYQEFAEDNIDKIDIVSEFDLLALGLDHTKAQRASFWDGLGEKFMPVWHPQHGMDELERLARRYQRVGVPGTALGELSYLGQRINTLSRQWGTKFHGMAATQPEMLRNVHFATAASTSWISPSKFGDTQVFDGERLRRYPTKYKAQARKRHKMLFGRAGFDADKILNDDPIEVTRFTVWSWRRFEETLAKRRGSDNRSTPFPADHNQDIALPDPPSVDRLPVQARSELRMLPVLGMDESETLEVAPATTVRVCSNCYVAATCPAYKPDNECAYALPLQLRSRDEMLAFLRGLVEMQAQRVMFGRFTEELEGGYPDPNLSSEIDRLMKLVKELKDIEDNRDVLKLNVEARAGAGMISRLFGERPPPAVGPGPQNGAVATVIDAEPEEPEDVEEI